MSIINPDPEIQELFTPLLAEFYSVKNPRTGKPIKFATKGHSYLYFRDRLGSDFCYTPHADQDGWYYSFAYMAIGAGSRTGEAKRWTMKYMQPHRRRKDAKRRALKLKEQKGRQ